jgi:hypothetical protein
MTSRKRRLMMCMASVAAGQLGFPCVAAADPAEQWSPGHRTTASPGHTVRADDEPSGVDGVYGRFEGDLALSFAAGAELESHGQRALLQVAAHYYWMAGVTASYREALGASRQQLSAVRLGSLGVDVRPLFIPRWSYGWQSGPATLDLLLDSISLAAGAYFAEMRPADRSRRRGFETNLGAAIPILGRAAGPWLVARYVRRWPEAGPTEGSVWVSLAWHVLVESGLATTTANVH